MVLLSAVVLLRFSILMTVIPLHLELSGLSVELLPVDRGHEPNEQSVLLNVKKTLLLCVCVCVFKMMWLHRYRISLHFNCYKTREIYCSAAGTALLKC